MRTFRENSIHPRRVSFYGGIFIDRTYWMSPCLPLPETPLQTVGCRHFSSLTLYPLACFTFPQDTPRMQVSLGIITDQLYLWSTHHQYHEGLRIWHHERLRQLSLYPATWVWSRKMSFLYMCVGRDMPAIPKRRLWCTIDSHGSPWQKQMAGQRHKPVIGKFWVKTGNAWKTQCS